MRCPKCGNELRPEEAFCGQCGTPITPGSSSVMSPRSGGLFKPFPPAGNNSQFNAPPATRIISQTLSQPGSPDAYLSQSGSPQPNTPHTFQSQPGSPQAPNIYPGQQAGTSTNAYSSQSGIAPSQQAANSYPSQAIHLSNNQGTVTPQQQHQMPFYQDATEAIAIMPGSGAAMAPPFAAPPHFNPVQPQSQFQVGPSGSYGGQRPGYDGPIPTPPPHGQQQPSNKVILVAGICCVALLIIVASLGALYFARGNSGQANNAPSPTIAPTTAPTATPTTAPTATPTDVPTPTVVPTPPADQGFAWCGPACINNGFQTEYPTTWQTGAPGGASGVEFLNPNQPDEYAAFKALGPTASTAKDIALQDIQTNFSTRPGYTPPVDTEPTTISGETWISATFSYTGDSQQPEKVVVYATVHEGKAFVIELQAPAALFDQVNAQVFINMLGKYQFQQAVQ